MGIEVHSRISRRNQLYDCHKHVVADAYFENMDILESYSISPAMMIEDLTRAIEHNGGHIISHQYHIFGQSGDASFSVLFMLRDSHVSLHSFPENKYVAIDVFTCGSSSDPIKIVQDIVRTLDAVDTDMYVLTRGPFLSI